MRVIIQEEALRRSEGHYYRHFIQELPTIDAAPVVHGRWKVDAFTAKYGNPYHCSICKEEYDNTHNYCPNCGAKMDVEESTNA